MATDNCLPEGESITVQVVKVCRHQDQNGKPVVLLTLTDGDVVALYVTGENATAMVAAMGGDALCFNGVPLKDLKATHAFALKATAGAHAVASVPRDVRVVETR